jgi:hypothetical protein
VFYSRQAFPSSFPNYRDFKTLVDRGDKSTTFARRLGNCSKAERSAQHAPVKLVLLDVDRDGFVQADEDRGFAARCAERLCLSVRQLSEV